MNREELMTMLKKAGVLGAEGGALVAPTGQESYVSQFVNLAVMLADYCAGICESRYMGDNNREDLEAKRCADAIRVKFKDLKYNA